MPCLRGGERGAANNVTGIETSLETTLFYAPLQPGALREPWKQDDRQIIAATCLGAGRHVEAL